MATRRVSPQGIEKLTLKVQEAIKAIPIVPVEWIYITAIASIAAVVAVYRKIA